ncbi:hypothetical protein RJ641_030712 [Dillenia turbinata]|uniref:Uncharacterized protein n=1 Tax=Dillenia turbinata TaxID=194707 RepID=A0AAN8VSV8_9MAGN
MPIFSQVAPELHLEPSQGNYELKSWREMITSQISKLTAVGSNNPDESGIPDAARKISLDSELIQRHTHNQSKVVYTCQGLQILSLAAKEKGEKIKSSLAAKEKGEKIKSIEPMLASSSVCSNNASNDSEYSSNVDSEDTAGSTKGSENVEEEMEGTKETASQGYAPGHKRHRSVESHNNSEARQRHRINKKMCKLQRLVPNCNKVFNIVWLLSNSSMEEVNANAHLDPAFPRNDTWLNNKIGSQFGFPDSQEHTKGGISVSVTLWCHPPEEEQGFKAVPSMNRASNQGSPGGLIFGYGGNLFKYLACLLQAAALGKQVNQSSPDVEVDVGGDDRIQVFGRSCPPQPTQANIHVYEMSMNMVVLETASNKEKGMQSSGIMKPGAGIFPDTGFQKALDPTSGALSLWLSCPCKAAPTQLRGNLNLVLISELELAILPVMFPKHKEAWEEKIFPKLQEAQEVLWSIKKCNSANGNSTNSPEVQICISDQH